MAAAEDRQPFVVGRFQYQPDSTRRAIRGTGGPTTPHSVRHPPGQGPSETVGLAPYESHELPVYDARGIETTLEEEGVCLVPHAWAHVDYYNERQIQESYLPECCRLVRAHTGAQCVLASSYGVRCPSRNGEPLAEPRGLESSAVMVPADNVHADHGLSTIEAGILKYEGLLGLPPGCRVQHINVWRNIADHPLTRNPLACADARTIPLDDLITYELRYLYQRFHPSCFLDAEGVQHSVDVPGVKPGGPVFSENYLARYSPSHRWLYWPRMTKDEALLIKQW